LPYYLVHERHLSLEQTAKVGGLAFLLKAVTALLSGRLSDAWISSGVSPTIARKTFVVAGLVLASLFLVIAAVTPGRVFLVPLLIATTTLGLSTPHYWSISQTLAGPKLAGTWTSLQSFAGSFAGVIAPVITGIVADRTGQLLWAFLLTGIVGLVAAMSWIFLVGPVQQVAWPDEYLAQTGLV
jgi:MFS family permease